MILNTNGEVATDYNPLTKYRWTDLDAFTQGYVEVMFASLTPGRWAFDMLAPETLARIIADCAAGVDQPYMMGRAYNDNDAGGRCFWRDRQAGVCREFPALTVQLGDDGKVRFA